MPSSTLWRRAISTEDTGRRSPVRPTEFIEPLSSRESSPDILHRRQNEHYTFGRPLHGLGVSYDAPGDERLGFDQPQALHIDQNGEAHIWKAPTLNGSQYSDFRRPQHDRARPHTRDGTTLKRPRAKAHTRSGSTIDDLASAAIATSPSFTGASSTSLYGNRPATSHVYSQSYTDGERPYKRVRSEMLPTSEWSPIENAPQVQDAELLLSLSIPFHFPNDHPSPHTPQKVFVGTPRVKPDLLRRIPEEDVSLPDIPAVALTLDLTPVKYSPKQSQLLPDKKLRIQSPTAPEPEPLTSPPPPETEIQSPAEDVGILQTSTDNSQTVEKQDLTESEIGVNHNILIGEVASEQKPVDSVPAEQNKRPRRIKPEVQPCAKCENLQQELKPEDGDSISWIKCNPCNRWFHAACVGFKDKREMQAVDKFVCSECEPAHGATTFVRKSSRARTAIDYAGLNQGLIKSSADTSMHHYIQPIKEGKIKFHSDDFARMRPELVTAEYFETTDGVKRPYVVPAAWNPRFGDRASLISKNEASSQAESPGYLEVSAEDFTEEEVIDCGQDSLDMVLPRDLTVRKVAELYGPHEEVSVIDVKSQQSSSNSNKWTMKRFADYYEKTEDKPILNVISLEITQSRLARIIRRPKLVREIDLQDLVWSDAPNTADYRPVQTYCLMSVADSYTDFHIDFGGSSVYYHILKGKKTFFFIPPEEKNLKKYEDWCNSDTQDTVFLGDLCGDCSRVDLSEGDTMFIPSGWIHAVWTPEDSLVIGGNFLTRTDYEMQLKIVEIEKNTGVAPKFRYPFFQKVMWYALIKYLEEDPVPQDMVDEFNEDEEYVFLRANPVWHEIGDLQNHAEPGQPEYNARFYSKPEIIGLPALRDYLYRTALISVDAPVVPPVTKATAGKVRKSIPKGHGEPMDLIKLFAIWCAWKTGNITAPNWSHPDAVTLQKLAEKREKLKKPEVFRIPPERTSSRKSSQALTDVPPLNGGATLVTPTKNNGGILDVESDDGGKRSSGSKTSGLGPKRSACDACRKRRIRCRHREEYEGPLLIEGVPRPRSLTNVIVEVPKLTPIAAVSTLDGSRSPHEQVYPDFGDLLQSNIAQAALATLDMQNGDVSTDHNTTPTTSAGKKGRSKACEECRKSKRRCVHDEQGRVDPTKAAEPSKPRGSATAKRPSLSSDALRPPPIKKPKLETDRSGSRQTSSQSDFEALIDPALMADTLTSLAVPSQSSVLDSSQPMPTAIEPVLPIESIDGPAEQMQNTGTIAGLEASTASEALPSDHLLDQQMHDAPLPEPIIKPEPTALTMEHVSSQTPAASLASPPDSILTEPEPAFSPITVNGMTITTSIETNGEKSEASPQDFYTPVSASRQSSRQPKLVDRYIPNENPAMTKPISKPVKTDRRESSSGASGGTGATSDKSRRSSSNTSGTTHQMAASQMNGVTKSRENSARPGSRGSTALSEEDADEAYARELQAQENGLRRRASGRV